MFTPKSLPPTRPIPLKIELNQDQLKKTTFYKLPLRLSPQAPSSCIQDLYLVKEPFSLPSKLSFSYVQALNLSLLSQDSENLSDQDFLYFKSSSQEEVKTTQEQDTSLVLGLKEEEAPPSFSYQELNFTQDEENLDLTKKDDPTSLSKMEGDDNSTQPPLQEPENREPSESQEEETDFDSFGSSSPFEDDQSNEEPSNSDVKVPSLDSSSFVPLFLDQHRPISTSTKNISLKFEEDMSGYFLKVKQDRSIQTLNLKGTIQPLCFQDDQVVLTLFNAQNECLTSWIVQYQDSLAKEDQDKPPFVQVPIQDHPPLTSTTLIPPIIVEDHTTPFAVCVVQDISSQNELVFDSKIEPLVVENKEEGSSLIPTFSSLPSSLLSSASPLSTISSIPSFSNIPSPPTSSLSTPLSSVSSKALTPNRSSLSSGSIPTSAISSPDLLTTSSAASPSLPLENSKESSTLDSTSLKAEVYEQLPQRPAFEQLAYPPTDVNLNHLSVSLPSNKEETLSSEPIVEKKTSTTLFKPLIKELQKQASQPLATVQQAGQVLSQGNTLYVKDPSEVQIHVENGTLQDIKVFSKESRKTYTSLEMAMEAEKQATFEMEANLKSNHSEQMSQAKWTIVPLGEPIEQSISLPAQEIKAFYALEDNGKLSSYRQSPTLFHALLCRGFEPLENQSVYPGESLRMYVEEEGDYDLSINGRHQRVFVQQDELGQPYIPVSVGALKTDIALQKDGTTIYSQSLQTNNPMVRFGWIAPMIGSLVGIVLDVRRRKWL